MTTRANLRLLATPRTASPVTTSILPMSRLDTDAAIAARVDEFVADLTELIREAALRAVAEALDGQVALDPVTKAGGSTPASKGGRSRRAGSSSKGASSGRERRTAAALKEVSDQVLARLRKAPGSGIEQLARDLGVPSAKLKRPIAHLIEAGLVRKTGEKRATKYFPKKSRSAAA